MKQIDSGIIYLEKSGRTGMKVGYVFDPIYLAHDTGAHVENASRLTTTMSHLEKTGLLSELVGIKPRPATVEEIAAIHERQYIAYIDYVARKGGAWLEVDTVMSGRSYDAAICAAGGAIKATESVLDGELNSCFALVRPPGHHATYDRPMGFCIFNNIAVATKYALLKYNLGRIAIIDFDVHHGNGTQEAFYSDPHVLYISTHLYPHYPGSGRVDETGINEGKGATLNIPLPVGCGDVQYMEAFKQVIIPAVRRYAPKLIMVSAGYDAHWADELAQMNVTTTGFSEMVKIIVQLAEELCDCKIVFVLEGGYHLEALSTSVKATFDVLLGKPAIDDVLGPSKRRLATPDISALISQIKCIHEL
jgi:acetoin utilization deacetylase AcuC-like enzyme